MPQSHDIFILRPDVRDHVDTFRAIFVRKAQYTLLPELLEIFGQENLLKFLDVFGGMTISVPDRSILMHSVRDTHIYQSISQNDNPDVTHRLALQYDIRPELVRDIYQRVCAIRKEMGL